MEKNYKCIGCGWIGTKENMSQRLDNPEINLFANICPDCGSDSFKEMKEANKNCDLSDVIKSVCDHPKDELIQTNGYRTLCLKCGRNAN